MYTFSPISDRVLRIRERYRNTTPKFSSERPRIITEFYKAHETEHPLLKRAKCMHAICERMTLIVGDDDLIVGNQVPTFRGATTNPEYGGVKWLVDELKSGQFYKRQAYEEYNEIDPVDADYMCSIEEYWNDRCLGTLCDAVIPDEFYPVETANILPFARNGTGGNPIGHFSANYSKAVSKGFRAIKDEALEKLAAMNGHLFEGDAEKHLFYRAVVIYCDAVMLLSKRYAAVCRHMAALDKYTPERRAELSSMADSLDHIIEYPARTFREAVQATLIYHLTLCFDGQMHGLTFGRFDQYTYPLLKKELEEGTTTLERAQEIVDCFFLKISEAVVLKTTAAATNSGGYSSGQHMSLGGVGRDGGDATNAVSYLMLQTMGRLHLHEPPLSLRIHKGTPDTLWEAAIACTKECGGIPTLQNDDVIIPTLLARGFTIGDARDYCIIGCVEPAGAGNDFPACGGLGRATYLNMGNLITMLINNGRNPLNGGDSGFGTGYLYDYKSFDEVMAAYKKHVEHYVNWHISMSNLFWLVMRDKMPLIAASATMDGCMESGRDVMYGGAKYNANGSSGVGCANVIDSLAVIKYMVFDKKLLTARELYDAIMADWKGYEPLRQRILNEVPRYGNDIPYVDKIARDAMEIFAQAFLKGTGDRGNKWQAGIYPVSTHVVNGKRTWATPDGRMAREALAEGVSPKQGLDKNGPAAVLKSVAAINHATYRNGTLLNMKFHPATVQGDEGAMKLRLLVETFFSLGGMHIQYNVVGGEQLREAQKEPDKYKNLVIRIAGFSAYFVELDSALQNDLISRTDQMVH
ncbi:formate C-acetyltransferase [Sporobacter termitidis DSM 10068]|uniref:Formate C-acetyltransferase n=1 Tax=Sporobacter termitidis DSM 10068 TaxID=1123282 RepID=A0A1M5X150_9FIRM|nr:pyruvate formate lyase family protein [Sporobacter termitidis]SHH93577.1 formate C-acetyltransferase [Sporobacter termitidis DSM 10068]